GTNAHVILEEAPAVETPGAALPDRAGADGAGANRAGASPAPTFQLLVLSAKTDSALESATDNLVAYLKQHPVGSLADIAYTYHVGRSAFNHRRMLVCHDLNDAVTTLETRDRQRVLTSIVEVEHRPVTFLFPGLGDHYINMAEQLYQQEPVFRAHVDCCCQLLELHLGLDLRDVLYPDRNQKDAQDRAKPGLLQPSPDAASLPVHLDLRALLGRGEGDGGGSNHHSEATQRLNQTVLA